MDWPQLAALLLQQWYGLSDPGLEEALADRLSFHRFVGLSLTEATPDHSTISRFRTARGEAGLGTHVRGGDPPDQRSGPALRNGTPIDASPVEAQVRRPRKPAALAAEPAAEPEAGSVAAPEVPAAPEAAPRLLVANPLDPEAS